MDFAAILEVLKPLLPILIRTLIGAFLAKDGITPAERKLIDVIEKLLELSDSA